MVRRASHRSAARSYFGELRSACMWTSWSASGDGILSLVRIATTCGLLASGCALFGASCSGGEESSGHVGAAADLPIIVAVRPATEGWNWPRKPSGSVTVTRSELGAADTHPLQTRLSQELRDAGFVRLDLSHWSNLQIGSEVSAGLFETSTGAHAALDAIRRFNRAWQTEVEHGEVTEVSLDGLGDEGGGLQQKSRGVGGSESATFAWREGNLVLGAHMVCGERCASDVLVALRQWATKIDRVATSQ